MQWSRYAASASLAQAEAILGSLEKWIDYVSFRQSLRLHLFIFLCTHACGNVTVQLLPQRDGIYFLTS